MKNLMGCSVTKRIRQVKQPYGGYIRPSSLEVIEMENVTELENKENIHASLIGISVDYLTRVMSGSKTDEAFKISLIGAKIIDKSEFAAQLLKQIKGLDDKSIICATKLAGFDVCFRAGIMGYRPVEEINPDKATIANIRTMVQRSLNFFEQFGPKKVDGFTFEGGYTDLITSGDGDFITEDTLWDFKVSKMKPKKDYTLQLLIYWRMGLHSKHTEFKSIHYLAIFNPRLNRIYRIDVNNIPVDIIAEVEKEVIGY